MRLGKGGWQQSPFSGFLCSRDRAVDRERPRSCAGTGQDPAATPMTGSARAHEKTQEEGAAGTSLCSRFNRFSPCGVVSVNSPGADAKRAPKRWG
jgi:hypothetical protein